MSKRTGAIALACSAVLAVGFFGKMAYAADPVPPAAPNPAPMPTPDVAPAADAGPTSVLNEYGLNKMGVGKFLADSNIKVGGYVEGSYTYNFRAPRNEINEGRVFDFEHNAARLNQIALQVARTVDVPADAKAGKFDIGFGIDMQYGSDARLIHANGLNGYNSATHPINQYDLTQAYLDFVIPVGNGLNIRVGKFVTPFGNETIAPIATVTGSSGNALYSHSYNFGFGIPFTHTGVLASYALSDKLSITAGITRGWEQATKDNNGSIDGLASVAYTVNDDLKVTGNISVGPQKAHDSKDYRYVFEALVAYAPKKSPIAIAVDGLFGSEQHSSLTGKTAYWYGVTGYVGYTLSDMLTLNGRAEWFRDDGGSRLGLSANFYEVTAGVSIKPFYKDKIGQNFQIRPEVRFDYADKDAFGGGSHKTQATAAVDAIFAL